MKILIILFFLSLPLYADICGDVSIGKDGENCKAQIRLGYDFAISRFNIVPYTEYTNYFRSEGLANHPYRDVFGTGLRINYDKLYLDIRHECRHEVSSLNSRDTPELYSDALPNASSTFVTVGYRFGKDFD